MGLYYRAYQKPFLTKKKKMAKLLAPSETSGQDFKMTDYLPTVRKCLKNRTL